MTVEQEIAYAKLQKKLNEEIEPVLTRIGLSGPELPEELDSELSLKIKYCSEAEELRGYDYEGKLHAMLRNKDLTPDNVLSMKKIVYSGRELTESNRTEDVLNGYRTLAEIYSLLEGNSSDELVTFLLERPVYTEDGDEITQINGKSINSQKDFDKAKETGHLLRNKNTGEDVVIPPSGMNSRKFSKNTSEVIPVSGSSMKTKKVVFFPKSGPNNSKK